MGSLVRAGKSVLDLEPKGFIFDGSPANYNFNAFVAGATVL